jgi:type IV pilus assembly protein PilB
MYNFTPLTARKLIDKYFSLQWCKDNLVIPISLESNPDSNNDIFWIAIANYAYLATISTPIKSRIKQSEPNVEIIFIEKSFEEIEEMLDKASALNK